MTCRTLDTKATIYLDARCPNFSLVHVTTALQPIAGSARRVRVALFESYSRGSGSYGVVCYAGGELVSRQVCSSEIRWFSLFWKSFDFPVPCILSGSSGHCTIADRAIIASSTTETW